jgi:Mg-chelatase subunit ChlD
MKTTTRETRRDKWVSVSLIAGALLAGLAALAAQRHGDAAAAAKPPAPPPIAKRIDTPTIASPPANPPTTVQAARPRVELVFALDTTGSMSGLIEGAKRKIWSIASFVARGQPTPDLRVGLVAYRDIGDEYVTRVYDLDDDLDRVYRRLLQFRADGGGDTPEHVARALSEAVHKMSWTKGDGQVARLIYLVGDAPPHVDYHDGYDYAKASRDAAQLGIHVHAIRCGNDPDTATYWHRIASLGHGEFLTIGQDGGMHDRHTPYDDELAKLHDELDDTVVPYGAGADEKRHALERAAAAPAPVKAARAEYFAAKKEVGGEDFVDLVANGKVDIDKVPAAELPASIAAAPPAERKAKVAEAARARTHILGRISKLSDDRAAYLRAQPADKDSGFDAEVENTVRKAGASIGAKF